MTAPRDSTNKAAYRRKARRVRSPLAGPMREVVYIFEREGERGGKFWWLVLECGHAVARSRHVATSFPAIAQAMFKPPELAPKRAQCHYCGTGCEKHDPALLIRAFGGDIP